jgi:hypothetical protein
LNNIIVNEIVEIVLRGDAAMVETGERRQQWKKLPVYDVRDEEGKCNIMNTFHGVDDDE